MKRMRVNSNSTVKTTQRSPNQSIFLKQEDDKDSFQRKEGIEGGQEEGDQRNVLQPPAIDGYQQGGGGGGGKEGDIKLILVILSSRVHRAAAVNLSDASYPTRRYVRICAPSSIVSLSTTAVHSV